MMLGEFERGGPSGKLIRAIMHGCYEEVITLIKQAVESNVAIGWIEVGDLLAIEAYCHYRLGDYALAVL